MRTIEFCGGARLSPGPQRLEQGGHRLSTGGHCRHHRRLARVEQELAEEALESLSLRVATIITSVHRVLLLFGLRHRPLAAVRGGGEHRLGLDLRPAKQPELSVLGHRHAAHCG